VFKLTVLNGQFEGVVAEVAESVTVGRAQDCGLFLPDPQVSRNHAKIVMEGDVCWLVDAGSHNGSYVNEIRVEGRRVLRNGDMIRFGGTKVEVSAPEAQCQAAIGAIEIDEEPGGVTMTVERNAGDLAPPTLDSLTQPGAPQSEFAVRSPNELRASTDSSLSNIAANARRFAILFHVSKALQESTDVKRLLASMLDHVFKVIRADRGEIVLVNEFSGELEPVLSIDKQGKVIDTVRLSRTVIGKVLNSRMAIITTDASSDPRLSEADSIIMYGMRSIMCAPMISKDKVIGIIQVVNERDFAAFSEDDLYLLTVIGSLAAVSIENARLHQHQKEALDELREAHEQLKRTQEELVRQAKLATVGQLVSGIAHEIKNTLGPIALVHLLKERHPDDDVLQEYSDLILEAHSRIMSIVAELRDFTRGGAPQSLELRREPLRGLLEGVVHFLNFDKDVKRTTLKLHVNAQVDAQINPDRLKQVFINLIRNAAQAVPEKGGRIDLTLSREGADAVVRVIDNGIGIPEENLAKIFTPFFTTKEETGMGLGLGISRMIVEQHKGRLECDSTPGKGTVMTVVLPAAD